MSRIHITSKILRAIETKRLNPEILGERSWYGYHICTTELVWSRNLRDGYNIDVYDRQYGDHLATVVL